MFDNSLNGNRRQFWKYIRAQRKDNHSISTLVVDGKLVTETRCKANALNKYFESVFTKESLTTIPSMSDTDNPADTLSSICQELHSQLLESSISYHYLILTKLVDQITSPHIF